MVPKYKRGISVILCVVFIMIMVSPAEAITEKPYDRMMYKFGRGLSNVVFSPVEIFRSVDQYSEETGYAAGTVMGIFHGVGMTVARVVTGLCDVVTFVQADPENYIMEPEFVFGKADMI